MRPAMVAVGMAVALVFAVGALVFALAISGERADTNAASIDQIEDLARQIQAERVRNIRAGCEAQNEQHTDAVAFIDKRIRTIPKSQRAAARANRDVTVAFINTLAPKRDCDRVVRSQVPSSKPRFQTPRGG